jgi:hypothetical protein
MSVTEVSPLELCAVPACGATNERNAGTPALRQQARREVCFPGCDGNIRASF